MRLARGHERVERQEMPGSPQPIRPVDARGRTSLSSVLGQVL
jgi:hypothetical protein